jgi:hypothetical protein
MRGRKPNFIFVFYWKIFGPFFETIFKLLLNVPIILIYNALNTLPAFLVSSIFKDRGLTPTPGTLLFNKFSVQILFFRMYPKPIL